MWSDICNVSYIELRIWNQVSYAITHDECYHYWQVRIAKPFKDRASEISKELQRNF